MRLSRLKIIDENKSTIQSNSNDKLKQETITNFINTNFKNQKHSTYDAQIETVELSSSSESNHSTILTKKESDNLSNQKIINESDLKNQDLQFNDYKLIETSNIQIDDDIIICENVKKINDNIDDDCCIILDKKLTFPNKPYVVIDKINIRNKSKTKTKKKQMKDLNLNYYFSLKKK